MPFSVARPPQYSGRHTSSAPAATASPARRQATSMASSKVGRAGVWTQPMRTSRVVVMVFSPVVPQVLSGRVYRVAGKLRSRFARRRGHFVRRISQRTSRLCAREPSDEGFMPWVAPDQFFPCGHLEISEVEAGDAGAAHQGVAFAAVHGDAEQGAAGRQRLRGLARLGVGTHADGRVAAGGIDDVYGERPSPRRSATARPA